MYISGTGSNLRHDLFSDVLIPLGGLKYSQRYREAEKALLANKQITHIAAHSLGGAIGTVLANKYAQVKSGNAYGSPITKGNSKLRYISARGDPVSLSSTIRGHSREVPVVKTWNTHSFRQFRPRFHN